MKSLFKPSFFAGNRQKLKALHPEMPIVVTANGMLQRGADSTYQFSQDASFWYLTGINDPDVILVMHDGQEFLIVPGRSASREAFDGSVSFDELSRRSGVKQVYAGDQGWQKIKSLLKQNKTIATLHPADTYVEQYGMYTNPARASLLQRLQAEQSDLELKDTSKDLSHLRSVKQKPELAAIQQAIDITIDSLQSITSSKHFEKYQYEYQIEALLTAEFRMRGASGHAFDPIVAGGQQACTLHNVANNAKLQAGDLLLMDVGAEVEHYAADISRTVSRGQPTGRQHAVHAAVLDVQQYAFGLLQAGVFIKEYEQRIEAYMGEHLLKLGLIKKNEHQAVRKFYPHATSHFLGLNVHDTGDYQQPLQAGMVVTVEPGIYVPAEAIGVRIEDDVLITDDGMQILTDQLPRDLVVSK